MVFYVFNETVFHSVLHCRLFQIKKRNKKIPVGIHSKNLSLIVSIILMNVYCVVSFIENRFINFSYYHSRRIGWPIAVHLAERLISAIFFYIIGRCCPSGTGQVFFFFLHKMTQKKLWALVDQSIGFGEGQLTGVIILCLIFTLLQPPL